MPSAAHGALLPTPIGTLAVLILLSCSAGMAGQDAVRWVASCTIRVPIDSADRPLRHGLSKATSSGEG